MYQVVKIQETVPGSFPKKAYEDDAAYDVVSAVEVDYGIYPSGAIIDVSLGFRMELPRDVGALILPRSSTSTTFGLWIPNSPGLIDPGFRGDMKVRTQALCPRPSHTRLVVKKGEKIAQLLFLPIAKVGLEVGVVNESVRGERGWGSSGVGGYPTI